MDNTADFLLLVEQRRKELGLSQVDVGRLATGRAENSIIQNLKRGASPSLDNVIAVCRALGLDIEIRMRRPDGQPGLSDPPARGNTLSPAALRPSDYLTMPWHDEARHPEVPPVSFSRGWFAANGLVPDDLRVVAPDNPPSRRIALIDTSQRKPDSLAWWCVLERGRVSLALIQAAPRILVIREADRTLPDRILAGADTALVRILGRVLWCGQTEDLTPVTSERPPP